MLRLRSRQYPDGYSNFLDIPAGWSWVGEWLDIRLVAEAAGIGFGDEVCYVLPSRNGRYVQRYDVLRISNEVHEAIMRPGSTDIDDDMLRRTAKELIATFEIMGLGAERTILSALLYNMSGVWGPYQYGPGEDDYEGGSYEDILEEIRLLWPGSTYLDKNLNKVAGEADVSTTAAAATSAVTQDETPRDKLELTEATVKDDGPGGRALMSRDARDKHVQGWLLHVKKYGGTRRDEYAASIGVSPHTLGKWVTAYNKRRK